VGLVAKTLTQVKSFKKLTQPLGQSLASQERSKKRDLFEQVKKEKELTQ